MLLSCQQCRQFDRIAIEEFGVPGVVLMENAGAGCVREMLERGMNGTALILCGSGNNGGDGFVVARHLINHGISVQVLLLGEAGKLTPSARVNFEIVQKMEIPVELADARWDAGSFASLFGSLEDDLVIVDAMLGTGARGELRSPYCEAVEAANRWEARRVAIDVPTGLDGDNAAGELPFRADLTCTFVAEKMGFKTPRASQFLGEVVVIDIGAPHSIFDRFDLCS